MAWINTTLKVLNQDENYLYIELVGTSTTITVRISDVHDVVQGNACIDLMLETMASTLSKNLVDITNKTLLKNAIEAMTVSIWG